MSRPIDGDLFLSGMRWALRTNRLASLAGSRRSPAHLLKGALIVALALLGSLPLPARAQDPPATDETAAAEKTIRANVAAFVNAYNAGDAKAVARLFAPQAQVIDEEGNTTQGRDAIEKVFAGIFAEAPGARMLLDIDSIRFIGSALAIESGTTKVTKKTGEPAENNRYTVVHVRQPGGRGNWVMALARDTAGNEPTPYERLKPLSWLVGDWVDEGRESLVMTSCKWGGGPNKSFLVQDIKIRIRGQDAHDLHQRIGWDPLTKRIKAWTFDAQGGYGESFWIRNGDHWLVKATGVRHDGAAASATNIFTPMGKDAYTWRSIDRVVGNEVLPPMEVKVVRKPPEPAR